jgi:RNA polymerase I-specific transcription initiation factor RRN3
MVSLLPAVQSHVPAPTIKPSKPLLRRGTIRKADDAGLDVGSLSAPPSPIKRARVTFNPDVEEKVMEVFTAKPRSLESVRAEVKRSIEAHARGDSEGYDGMKNIFVPRKREDEDMEDKQVDLKTYLIALTGYASLLNSKCGGLVRAILACEWMGRDEGFVKAYVQFLGSLASAQGAYVQAILEMLVKYFYGGKLSFACFTVISNMHCSEVIKRPSSWVPRCQPRSINFKSPCRHEVPPSPHPFRK